MKRVIWFAILVGCGGGGDSEHEYDDPPAGEHKTARSGYDWRPEVEPDAGTDGGSECAEGGCGEDCGECP